MSHRSDGLAGRRRRGRRRPHGPGRVAPAVLAASLVVVLGTFTRSAPDSLREITARAAGTLTGAGIPGNDVSWPQCPRLLGGYGLPLPPPEARFVVIGLTRGRPYTRNPCLGEQVAWAWRHEVPAHAYTMAASPTAEQLRSTGDRGPWPATSRAGRLRNAGHAQARDALRALHDAGFAPPVVWLDVEHLRRQPWPVGSPGRRRDNRDVLRGIMRGFADAGMPYGIYSYPAGWREITGSWRLPEVPVWATAGRSGRARAVRLCDRPGFSGGPVHLAQWYDDVRDSNITCPPFRLVPERPAPPP